MVVASTAARTRFTTRSERGRARSRLSATPNSVHTTLHGVPTTAAMRVIAAIRIGSKTPTSKKAIALAIELSRLFGFANWNAAAAKNAIGLAAAGSDIDDDRRECKASQSM